MDEKVFLEILKEVLETKLDTRKSGSIEIRQSIYDSVKHKIEKEKLKVKSN